MPKVRYQGHEIEVAPGVSLLDALLAEGHEVPNGCRAGACQSCLMQAVDGTVPEAAQSGLKDSLRVQGYFLACSCVPEGDLTVRLPETSDVRIPAAVTGLEALTPDILRVRLSAAPGFEYRAGQYVTLWRDADLGRSYSLASVPALDGDLELHVRRVPGGQMSNWLHDELRLGDALELQGPAGDCFYLRGEPEQPLLLIGTGTGLAPLYGIVRDALAAGHRGVIRLFHGARDLAGLYLGETLQALAESYANFTYQACVLNADESLPPAVAEGAIDTVALQQVPDLKGWRVYLCGDPGLVKQLRMKAFLAGANSADIYADPFLDARQGEPAA